MKKLASILTAVLAVALLSLTLTACGDTSDKVDYSGTYRLTSPVDGYYRFLVISDDALDMYYGTTEDFAAAVKLENGDFTITRRDSNGVAATCDSLPQLSVEYAAGTDNGAPALIDETNELTYVQI